MYTCHICTTEDDSLDRYIRSFDPIFVWLNVEDGANFCNNPESPFVWHHLMPENMHLSAFCVCYIDLLSQGDQQAMEIFFISSYFWEIYH